MCCVTIPRASFSTRTSFSYPGSSSSDWILEGDLNRDAPPAAVHVGGCRMAGKRWKGVPRDVALRALAEGVEACGHCRPEAELGFVDG
ncbi:DUF6233 domain-containing protein [Streptomyces sp. Ru62]|uniref:DUF6233 domain-containing protein n=1 Tax=Streptomyces sp. Ru62 TaxID=2080745 RepID=UPI002156070E|nr:DUF6233 domain-containing protein [Streptomyces sp. Ru62]